MSLATTLSGEGWPWWKIKVHVSNWDHLYKRISFHVLAKQIQCWGLSLVWVSHVESLVRGLFFVEPLVNLSQDLVFCLVLEDDDPVCRLFKIFIYPHGLFLWLGKSHLESLLLGAQHIYFLLNFLLMCLSLLEQHHFVLSNGGLHFGVQRFIRGLVVDGESRSVWTSLRWRIFSLAINWLSHATRRVQGRRVPSLPPPLSHGFFF